MNDTIADRIKKGMAMRGLRQTDIIEKTGINKGALSSYMNLNKTTSILLRKH